MMKILTTKTLQRLLVTGALMLQINGCDDTVSVEQNTSTDSEVNVTVTPTVNPTLSLSVGATTLNKTDHANLTLMGSYADGSTKPLETQAQWIVLPTGSVEVNGTTFTALKDGNVTVQAKVGTTLSNAINLNITWVVNGHTLPPEPDPAVNNATLLGVDVNDNGVRDDVERLVIIEEAKNTEYPKIQTAIALQYAWAWQKMIESPTLETRKYLEKASACQWYFYNKKLKDVRGYLKRRKWRINHSGILGVSLQNKLFNTKERTLQRLKFNKACSGNIFNGAKKDIQSCQTNIDKLGE